MKPGDVICERYLLGARLSSGGFAEVWRGRHVELGYGVAIKILHTHLADDEDAVQRFKSEGRRLAELKHDKVVQIYDVCTTPDGRPCLVMELLEGTTLADVIAREGRLSLGRATRFLRQLAAALDYVHGEGVFHRDVKPSNVMIDERSRKAVLFDFGIARDAASHLTQPGETLGTLRYMSPEQERGDAVDRRTDIYSLGVLAYEMLAGCPPFDGDTASVRRAIRSSRPPVDQLPTRLPSYVADAIEIAMAKDPEERPASASEFVDRLSGKSAAPTTRRIEPDRTLPLPRDGQAGRSRRPSRQGPGAGCLWLGLGLGALTLVLALVLVSNWGAIFNPPATVTPASAPGVLPTIGTVQVPRGTPPAPATAAATPSVRPQPGVATGARGATVVPPTPARPSNPTPAANTVRPGVPPPPPPPPPAPAALEVHDLHNGWAQVSWSGTPSVSYCVAFALYEYGTRKWVTDPPDPVPGSSQPQDSESFPGDPPFMWEVWAVAPTGATSAAQTDGTIWKLDGTPPFIADLADSAPPPSWPHPGPCG